MSFSKSSSVATSVLGSTDNLLIDLFRRRIDVEIEDVFWDRNGAASIRPVAHTADPALYRCTRQQHVGLLARVPDFLQVIDRRAACLAKRKRRVEELLA